MPEQVARLAVHRDRDLRPDHLIHRAPARRGRDGRRRGRNDPRRSRPRRRSRNSALCSRPIAFSLPGMMRDEKITTSPSSSTMLRMVVAGDAGQRGARLALAAGADQHDLVARHVAGLVLGQKARHVGEIAVLARRLVHPPQRAPDQRDVAVVGRARHARSSTAARHSRRSRRPRPARHSGRSARSSDWRSSPSEPEVAVAQRVCRIADDRQHALVADRPQPRPRRSAIADQRLRDRASSRRCAARCRPGCGSRPRSAPGSNGSA